MRIMFDSVQASSIPSNAPMVAGYVDGNYVWSDDDWSLFPNAVKIRIAVNPATNDGHVLDVEPGNWDDAASVAWVQMRRAAGVEPTIYCGEWAPDYSCDGLAAVFQAANEPMPNMWLASYDGVPSVPDGYVAKQFVSTSFFDLSIVNDNWPGVDQ